MWEQNIFWAKEQRGKPNYKCAEEIWERINDKKIRTKPNYEQDK